MESSTRDHEPEWDEVETLFGGYLHQDYLDDYGDEWNAVRHFCADSSATQIATAADQVKDILERIPDEEHLESLADRLGSEHYPPGIGQTYREWLTELEQFLRAASTAPSD